MRGIWDVYLNGETVGTCSAKVDGLYTFFNCSCKVTDSRIYRLYLCVENRECRLGIPLPMDKELVLTTRLPSSALPDGLPGFKLVPLGDEKKSNFVLIEAGKSFPYLDKIENSVLVCKNGQIGICV